ncbi:Vegetative incompatibility protein HET-E-1 [Colletotrichum fructicola Nara gc5]|uniref:Vegetative incompatibility protein HET-E-1 n=1 Tax=Colletotrichum fructicola (strain Nara gc5) TaxID=1213859 RepID=A0A7J6IYY6_COLFN|nr:Vegetative incompatibility protein HET-E-1 [Colletotrichum fructicola Nara gc5]
MVDIYEKVLSSSLVESAVAQVTMDVANCFANSLDGEIVAAVDVVKAIAGFIVGFVAAYPPAAMALSGVSTILTVLVKPLQENRDMVAGLEYVMEVSERHMALCRLLLREIWHKDSDFQAGREMLKARVTSLYVAVLTYQMKCVCQCYHDHPVTASIKAILSRTNWKSEMEIVKVREEGVQSDACLYNQQVTIEFLRSTKSDAHELPQISHLLNQLNRSIQDANLARILKEKEENQRYQSELTGRFNVTSYEDQMKLNSLHVEGTCEWFRGHNHFRKWLDSGSDRILLVSANPGCGKSVLANYLINNVIPEEKPEATICYYFFKDNAEQSELSNAYSAILHVLCSGNGKLADDCKFDIEKAGLNLTKRPTSLWEIFSKAVKVPHAGPIVCILDALDECSTEGLRILVTNLVSLYAPPSKPADTFDVRFLLTTRGYPAIIERFNALNPFCVRLAGENDTEVKAIQKEIDVVVKYRLNKLASRRRFEATQTERLGKYIERRGGEQRTYIWASLVFEVLEGAYPDNNDRWEELVNNLPRTAYAAYAKLLERVQPEEKKRVIKLLHLILAAFRPLSLREMKIAINVHDRPGSDSIDDLNMVSDEAFRDWLVNTCGFFVTEYGGRVYFIHQTAKEFLLSIGDGSGRETPYRESISSPRFDKLDLASAHASMAESCISYLSLRSYRVGIVRDSVAKFAREMRRGSQDWQSDEWKSVTSHPFAEYVIHFWPTHLRRAQRFESEDRSTDVKDGYVVHYLSLFEDIELQHPGIFATLRAQSITTLWADPLHESSDTTDNTPYDSCLLFFTDKLGITSVPMDTADVPKLHRVESLAALLGHLRVLRNGVDLLKASRQSGTWGPLNFLRIQGSKIWPDSLPVMSATIGRSIPCLEYVISNGSPMDFQGPSGWTPMHWAADSGYPEAVGSLLKHRIEMDGYNDDSHTPLLAALASSNAHIRDREAVARLLILGSCGRKANLAATTANGRTPLHLAILQDWSRADKRLDGVGRQQDVSLSIPRDALENSFIKLLVDNGANLNAVDDDGQTPLMLACSEGRREHVACLLYSGADPNEVNSRGSSPLGAFVCNNSKDYVVSRQPYLDTVRLLLEHGADPNATLHFNGYSILHFACDRGWSGIVSALLHHGADVTAKDGRGRTPIQIAARQERRLRRENTIVQLLNNGADPSEPELTR